MAQVHLVVGSTGAGKSTYCIAFAEEQLCLRFAIDEWMRQLFEKDRPEDAGFEWYMDRIHRCTDVIWSNVLQALQLGVSSVLEIGLTQKAAREAFYARARAAGVSVKLHVVHAPVTIRWQRVEARNQTQGPTFSVEVTREMFDFVETLWEPPDAAELAERESVVVHTA